MPLYVGFGRQSLQSNYYMYAHRTKGNPCLNIKGKYDSHNSMNR